MTTVEERLAVIETKQAATEASVERMGIKVDEMHAILLQAKGARWMVLAMVALGGFVAGMLTRLMPLLK